MSKLIDTQQQLLQAIFSETMPSETRAGAFDHQGLTIYRNNLRATATQALNITFPTVKALIGAELFAYATTQLLSAQAPHHGDWAQWGSRFADILAQIDELKDYPFVADCARLDYVCHQLSRAVDHQSDIKSLQLLNSHEPDIIRVELAPQLTLIASLYPLDAIRLAHKLSEQSRKEKLMEILQSHSAEQPYYFICHRNGYEVLVTSISALEYRWHYLLTEHSLGEALSLIDIPAFSFEKWLLSSIRNNVISKFYLTFNEE